MSNLRPSADAPRGAFAAASLALALSAGCAREAAPVASPASAPEHATHYAPASETSLYDTPTAPPRLSQTVRIGADDDAYTDARIYVDRGDRVVVIGDAAPAPAYGYGYGYYGYGSRSVGRYGYGTGYTTTARGVSPSQSAPGTFTPFTLGGGTGPAIGRGGYPNAGGNWPSVPSYGGGGRGTFSVGGRSDGGPRR